MALQLPLLLLVDEDADDAAFIAEDEGEDCIDDCLTWRVEEEEIGSAAGGDEDGEQDDGDEMDEPFDEIPDLLL